MIRRNFIGSLPLLVGGLALAEAIPFNRVWFFPKQIRLYKPYEDDDPPVQLALCLSRSLLDRIPALFPPDVDLYLPKSLRDRLPTLFPPNDVPFLRSR